MKNLSHNIHISAGHLLHTLCVALFLATSALPSSGQTAAEKAKRDIEAHRAWVETHVPLADTLNDEQLILAALDAVSAVCFEDKYVNILRQAGRRFQSDDLMNYADIRKSGTIIQSDSLAPSVRNNYTSRLSPPAARLPTLPRSLPWRRGNGQN